MDAFRKGLITMGASVLGFATIVGALYFLSTKMELETLRWFFVGLVLTVFTAVPLSYYFGHSEARGFLQGADKIADATLGHMVNNLEKRDRQAKAMASLPQADVIDYQPLVVAPPELGRRNGPAFTPRDADDL